MALTASGISVYAGGSFASTGTFPHSGIAGFIPPELVSVPLPAPAPIELAFTRLSPNPTAGRTRIEYAIPVAGHVRLGVYDVQGRLLSRPIDEIRSAGHHVVAWEPGSRSSGLYFLRLEYGGRRVTRNLVLIR
ncbi:MAG: T9SS type A sorting domain-containing protein [Candidatus Eisenbacteria bacterium]|uniref:T9SS type A sorting domain-containing protein n=1 Tax=Eiseniibacteriota bacterium TaxID=2212470 RepID=A0A538U3Q2_UNCEI|nr:MAG: T9SS type A sorting domain-containing protein [Candidatus Eisenbacteria bacterium]